MCVQAYADTFRRVHQEGGGGQQHTTQNNLLDPLLVPTLSEHRVPHDVKYYR